MSTLERLAQALSDRYRIERELGQGGMATVFLAADLKHDRQVAIKVLKPELAAVIGAERFVVEIKTTAALQHPHILPLFDSGSVGQGGGGSEFLYYVMPYIDGETLRAKLDRETQLGIDEAVRITTAVADALDYAHRHGVVHRDIKPENILLHDGRPMVADFGIALALSAAAGGRMTETGMSLGTPHYMSPEQATADKEITGRSDIYSLASVCYEMLTGEPPHTGSSAQQIIMKIVAEEVQSVTRLRKTVPPNVAAALGKALEKLPADRFETAKAFAEALNNPAFTTVSRRTVDGGHVAAGGVSRRVFALTVALLLVAIAAAAAGWLRSEPPQPVRRYTMAFPPDQALEISAGNGTAFALSPDGSRLVYAGRQSEASPLWLRDRSQLSARPIPGSEGGASPAFSPEGDRVAFTTRGTRLMKVVDLAGTAPITIAEPGAGVDGLTWSTDGYIYYEAPTLGGTVGLKRIRPEGGTGELVTTVDTAAGEADHLFPASLPDGRGLLFTVKHRNPRLPDSIAAFDADRKTWHGVVEGVAAQYAASGHLVYVTEAGDLMAVPFNLKTLEVTGEVRTLATGVRIGNFGNVALTLSGNGTLMYSPANSDSGPRDIVYVTRTGAVEVIDSTWSAGFRSLALSPDGRRLAASIVAGGEEQVWVKQLPDGFPERVSFEGTVNTRPTWHPDGRTLGYLSNRGSQIAFWASTPGAATPEVLQLSLPEQDIPQAFWSPDGAWIVYHVGTTTRSDIFARRVGSDTSIALLDSDVLELQPALSPDGRWLAFMTASAESPEVFVRPFPATQSRVWKISMNGGIAPVWSRSGRELFFSTPEGLISVEVLPGESFREGRRTTIRGMVGYGQWDVTPDDARFIAIRRLNRADVPEQLIVVENLLAELRDRRVP